MNKWHRFGRYERQTQWDANNVVRGWQLAIKINLALLIVAFLISRIPGIEQYGAGRVTVMAMGIVAIIFLVLLGGGLIYLFVSTWLEVTNNEKKEKEIHSTRLTQIYKGSQLPAEPQPPTVPEDAFENIYPAGENVSESWDDMYKPRENEGERLSNWEDVYKTPPAFDSPHAAVESDSGEIPQGLPQLNDNSNDETDKADDSLPTRRYSDW